MDEEKVVSIEERIPKLREARRKKSNRRLIFYLCLFFVLISVVLYLLSGLSYIKTIEVSGNDYTDSEYIIAQSGLSEEVNFWSFTTTKIEEELTNTREIKEASVSRVFPNHIKIQVEEYRQIGYLNETDGYRPLLENGTLLDIFQKVDYRGDAPLLHDFNNQEYLTNFNDQDYFLLMTEQLAQLSETISSHISEIYWEPTESSPFLVRLLMNDGLNVIINMRHLSDQMTSYPSIVSQLDETSGTIEMSRGGAIYYSEEETESDEAEEIDIETESEGDEDNNESEG